jgi:hypothetical protein
MSCQDDGGVCVRVRGDLSEAEEQERLKRIAEQRALNLSRYQREYGDLSDEEVIADLYPTTDEAMAPVVMTVRLNASLSGLRDDLKRLEKLTWALILLTAALLLVTIAVIIYGLGSADLPGLVAPLLLPILVRMQPAIASVLTSPRARQPIFPAVEGRAALGTGELGRWDAASLVVGSNARRVGFAPCTVRLGGAFAAARVEATEHVPVQPVRRCG